MAAAKELSLCWSCRNAVPDRYGNGCSWSRDAIPVAGWVADLNRKTDSWHVNRCPEYAQDPPEMIRPDMDTNTEAVDRLRMAILKQAASDYDGAIRYEAKQTKKRRAGASAAEAVRRKILLSAQVPTDPRPRRGV